MARNWTKLDRYLVKIEEKMVKIGKEMCPEMCQKLVVQLPQQSSCFAFGSWRSGGGGNGVNVSGEMKRERKQDEHVADKQTEKQRCVAGQ